MNKFLQNHFRSEPLGMNLRNYAIQLFNPRESMILAKDKIATKKLLTENGIPVPKTYLEKNSALLPAELSSLPPRFVIKPSQGHGGNGILVLERNGEHFSDPAGNRYSFKKIREHVKRIIEGEYSGSSENDTAVFEERLEPSARIIFRYASGLPDIRVFCLNSVPVMAMMRYATKESNGRANLSMGAIGLSIDLASGRFKHIHRKDETGPIPFSYLGIDKDFIVPKWEEMKMIAAKASSASGLRIAGVDLILDSSDQVMVLEINGRPGIEIQNVNEESLLGKLGQLN